MLQNINIHKKNQREQECDKYVSVTEMSPKDIGSRVRMSSESIPGVETESETGSETTHRVKIELVTGSEQTPRVEMESTPEVRN